MNGSHARNTRFLILGGVVASLAALTAPARTSAQQLPAIGLSPAFAQLHQENGNYPHSPGAADHLGWAVAAGDFNGDGYDDLASGIPGNDCDFTTWDCGSVQVRFGSAAGALGASVTLDPAAPGAPDLAHEFDEYGWSLTTGDFDADGRADLAVGIPGNYGFDSVRNVFGRLGAVAVHYGLDGSLGSIQPVAGDFLVQGSDGVHSSPHPNERFGAALAVGDFDGDGHDDLAIGTPRDNSWGSENGGNVIVAHGHDGGLLPFVGFHMIEGLLGLPDTSEEGEEFGYALAAGDFNGDGFDDLAIGVPSEDDVGAVLVVYGSPWSLLFNNHWYFSNWDFGGQAQPGGRFGESLAAGDFDGDGYDDLAAGAPRLDDSEGDQDAGQVTVVYGSASGLTAGRWDWLSEDALHGAGTSEPFDNFGNSLAAGDFNGDGVDDLAVGTSGEDSAEVNTGGLSVVMGRRLQNLLGGTVRRLFPRGERGFAGHDPAGMIPDYLWWEPFWGKSLAAGDFDGNGFSDLAIGAPGRDILAPQQVMDSGAVAVLFGQLFVDGFEGGDAREWSAVAH